MTIRNHIIISKIAQWHNSYLKFQLFEFKETVRKIMLLLEPGFHHLSIATSDSSKIFPELSLLHAEQNQFSWPLLTGQILQSPWWPLFLSPSCVSVSLLYWAAFSYAQCIVLFLPLEFWSCIKVQILLCLCWLLAMQCLKWLVRFLIWMFISPEFT